MSVSASEAISDLVEVDWLFHPRHTAAHEQLGCAEGTLNCDHSIATVPISSLTVGDTPRRSGIDDDHLQLLIGLDVAMPPILVHRPTMRVVDGVHRLLAAKMRGEDTVRARLVDGSEDAAFVLAIQANTAHGLPLSLADRRTAAARIISIHSDWSDRAVAVAAGLSPGTVAAIRARTTEEPAQSNMRIGRDGRLRPLSAVEGRRLAAEMVRSRPEASLREIASAAGISVGTAHDVRQRIEQGADPARHRRRSRNGSDQSTSTAPDQKPPPAVGHAPEIDLRPVLDTLKRDPSLRYSESGRSALRLLDLRLIRPEERTTLAETVPTHSAFILIRFARQCARLWEGVAQDLERRVGDAG